MKKKSFQSHLKMFLEELEDLIHKGKISDNSRILFVNDGSKDKTWEIVENLAAENPHFIGMSQSRNRGHQNAVLAAEQAFFSSGKNGLFL